MYCKKCGAQIDDEAYVCVHCGALVRELPREAQIQTQSRAQYETAASKSGYGKSQEVYPESRYPYGGRRETYDGQSAGDQKSNGMAIAGFVCSFFIALLGLIFSCIGLSRSKQMNGKGEGLAKAGIIISSVWMALVVIYAIIAMSVASAYIY